MTPIDFALYLNLAVFLIYTPIVCYLDVKYREVNPYLWIPLLLICTPIAAYMYLGTQWYPWYSFVISIVMCLIFYFAMQGGCLEGGDFLFLCFISLFWVMTPFPPAHGLTQIVFYIYFAFTSAIAAIYVLVYNILNENEWGIVDMMSNYPRGIPYMLPIAAAFLLSVVLG